MIKTLHARGFINREPGKARSITLRLSRAQLADLAAHSGPDKTLLSSARGLSRKRPGGTSASRREESTTHPGPPCEGRVPFQAVDARKPIVLTC